MLIREIEGATRRLGAPADWGQSKSACDVLPIVDVDTDNGPFMVSAWQPNAEELAALNAGAPIRLWIQGTNHPVVALAVDPPADLSERAHLAAGQWATSNTPIAEALAYRDGFIAGASSPAQAADGPTVAWMHIDDPRDCVSDAKKRDMIEHTGAPGARLAANYSIALGKIAPAQAAEPAAIPADVRAALDRMCTPLDESVLRGATAAADAHSMKVICDYVLRAPLAEMTAATRDVLAERLRQVKAEGWTPEHDEKYRDHELSCAAGCYAMYTLAYPAGDPPPAWPWGAAFWKPTTHRRNLVKAGALILAEIERLDRAEGNT